VYRPLRSGYCFFFSGSGVAGDGEPPGVELLAPPLGEPEVLPLAAPEVLGLGWAAELEPLLVLGEVALAPPEAEPDFAVSLPAEELDDELGEVGLDEAPLDGDEGEVLGVLELEEPGVDEVLLELSLPRSHAARPKASATAAARMESFMCPPWLGYLNKVANCAPGLTP
jgi:hypothetical protein